MFRQIVFCVTVAGTALLLPLAVQADEEVTGKRAGGQPETSASNDPMASGVQPVPAASSDAPPGSAPLDADASGQPSRAKSVPLDQPVLEAETIPEVSDGQAESEMAATESEAAAPQSADNTDDHRPLVMLGSEVPPSTTTRLSWTPSQSLEGIATPTPVLIVNGARTGPTLCLTAAIHGDELNGIEIVRRVLYNLESEALAGTVIGVPIVNLQGFVRSSRYLTDRRDLNRFFPGNPDGSSASRIAYSFFEEVIRHCDALVDLHTGSFHRTNMPQLRADLQNPEIVQLTQGFGGTVVLHSEGAAGTLRRAAADAGIPAVTLEAGESMRLQEAAVEHGVNGLTTLMSKMGMIKRFSFWGAPEPVYNRSFWVRADQGGILFSSVDLADRVGKGDLLGEVTDPITNIKSAILSPYDGRVIGMALNQVVLPGFAAFHIAIAAPPELVEEAEPQAAGDSVQGAPANKAAEPTVPMEPDVMDIEDDLSGMGDGDDFD